MTNNMEKLRRKTWLDSTTEESSSLLENDSLQMDSLHPKKREDTSPNSRAPRDQTIECDIQPSDTLSNLALKYNIPLAELKRVNNIMKDSEFFALKRIKIPVKPASFLKDLIPGVHSEANRQENGWYVESKDTGMSSNLSSSMVSSGYSSPCSEPDNLSKLDPSRQENRDKKKVKKFLKDMDIDLERIKERQSNSASRDDDSDQEQIDGERREEVMYTNFDQDDGLSNGPLICWCFLIVLLVLSVLAILAALMHVDHHAIPEHQSD